MNTERKSSLHTGKLVSVRVWREELEGNELYLLFTMKQIEEVLSDIIVRPVPFAPSFLTGLCNWRGKVMPVIDIEKRLGFSDTGQSDKRFLVIRTGTSTNPTSGKILRCVLQVSDAIRTTEIPASCVAVNTNQVGVESSLLRGAYQGEQDSYIVPDLPSILQDQESTNIF